MESSQLHGVCIGGPLRFISSGTFFTKRSVTIFTEKFDFFLVHISHAINSTAMTQKINMNEYINRLKEQPETALVGQKWTHEEEMQLVDLLESGKDIDSIAKKHKRTTGGINARMKDIAVRMIEKDGKSMEDTCLTMHLTREEILDAQIRRDAMKPDENKIIEKTICNLRKKGIALPTIKKYVMNLHE